MEDPCRMIHAWRQFLALLRNREVAFSLTRAGREYRHVERACRRRLTQTLGTAEDLEFPHLHLPPTQYLQRNFFSILFMSIYEVLGIPKDRRALYGRIMHGVRGIVTATDNILDDEDKGAVRLRLRGGRVLPNVLLILLQDGIVHEAVAELSESEARRRQIWEALMRALEEIAREESADEEPGGTVLSPGELLSTVHFYRGGRLLQLAFVAPAANEEQLADGIAEARLAVHLIGLGLQVLDDVTDFSDDVRDGHHSLLQSWIVHRSPDGPVGGGLDRDALLGRADDPTAAFPHATAEVLCLALEFARQGFEHLHGLGHAIDARAALDLAEVMFRLRGLSHLWDFYRSARDEHAARVAAAFVSTAVTLHDAAIQAENASREYLTPSRSG
jgi:hypothetical protein